MAAIVRRSTDRCWTRSTMGEILLPGIVGRFLGCPGARRTCRSWVGPAGTEGGPVQRLLVWRNWRSGRPLRRSRAPRLGVSRAAYAYGAVGGRMRTRRIRCWGNAENVSATVHGSSPHRLESFDSRQRPVHVERQIRVPCDTWKPSHLSATWRPAEIQKEFNGPMALRPRLAAGLPLSRRKRSSLASFPSAVTVPSYPSGSTSYRLMKE
jgi:hypothetical protein